MKDGRKTCKALEKKLELKQSTSFKRHDDYYFVRSGKKVELPVILRVSRGKFTPKNYRGLADSLGLNETSMDRFVVCSIGQGATLLTTCYAAVAISARRASLQGFIEEERIKIFRKAIFNMLSGVERIELNEHERSAVMNAQKRAYSLLGTSKILKQLLKDIDEKYSGTNSE